jgi:hypothetical protein
VAQKSPSITAGVLSRLGVVERFKWSLTMKILIVAFEDERWGVIRLVKGLEDAGFAVAALCAPDHAIIETRFLQRHYVLEDVTNRRRIETALADAIRDWKPDLIIPGDERAVSFLHALVRRAKRGARVALDGAALSVVAKSLGDADHYDTLLLKSETIALARRCGVRTPEGGSVSSAEEAVALARRIGFPVYVKQAFSWAGQGVIRCQTAEEVAAAYASVQPPRRRGLHHKAARRLLGRDWYPVGSKVDVQKGVEGSPAFYSALAWRGKMVAGFAGLVEKTRSENGPSVVVRVAMHEEMARMSSELIAATGASGFIGFDFMIEAATRKAYLLECNARPVQCCHLGPRIGVDPCAALAAAMFGDTTPPD